MVSGIVDGNPQGFFQEAASFQLSHRDVGIRDRKWPRKPKCKDPRKDEETQDIIPSSEAVQEKNDERAGSESRL